MADKITAVEAYVNAFRSGEASAAERAGKFLAPDVTLVAGQTTVTGHKDVLFRITGQWPNTPVFAQGAYTAPTAEGDKIKVGATFAGLGAAPAAVDLAFSFNGAGLINKVEQVVTPQPAPTPTNKLPDFVKGMVNDALRNGTPMTVAYVDEEGRPSLSLRGSTYAMSDTQLAIWVRNAEGGIIKALAKNNNISLLYRDQKSRSTLIFQGKGSVATDEPTRNRVYDATPEVEQMHDPNRKGACLVIDIERAMGGTGRGGMRFSKS
jgi:hypothetical protein